MKDYKIITSGTLVPITAVIAMAAAAGWLSVTEAKVKENSSNILKLEIRQEKMKDIQEKNFNEIIGRLSRIEGYLKADKGEK